MARPRSSEFDNARKTYGKKVMMMNLSDEEIFCAHSGRKLANRGMVVEYEGAYYAGWNETEAAHKAKAKV